LSVKDSLLAATQREQGGSIAIDRFDYQTAWGISRLLELHQEGKNYAVAFEFHDDIIVLNDATDPISAVFYQIKTKASGYWLVAEITERSKTGKKASFAGKMFDNFRRFGAAVERLYFVSNLPLHEVVVVHGEKELSAAKSAALAKFVDELTKEASDFQHPQHTSLFFFSYSSLNLSSYEETVIGKVASFLEEELNLQMPPRPFALILNDYCRKRSKSLADVASFDHLKKSKFVTRDDVLKWLALARDQYEQRPDWSSIAAEIDLPFGEKYKIERAWREYDVTLRTRTNAASIAFTERLGALVHAEIDRASDLLDLIESVFPAAKKLVIEWKPLATDYFVKAAILYEMKR
jgi:hypothetical protein